MDASQYRSEASRLDREAAAVESETIAILNAAHSAASRLNVSCENASRTLQSSANVIAQSEQKLLDVIAEQENIGVLYRGFKNIETANKKIRELTNKIYFEFSNFRMVRKIVRAFIDNINLDMVKPELIYKSVEKEHLQSPDFWLSCAMLAIMHWRDDDKAAAERAINRALELDERQTMLFFMSFNLLLDRKDAALKWFECYLRLEKTGNDAAVILLLLHAANLREKTDDPVAKRIIEYLNSEYENSKLMNDWDEAVELVKGHLIQYNSASTFTFNALRNYVKDYAQMANTLSMAKDNAAILEFIESINSATRGKGYVYVEKFLNNLLDEPDKKEKAYTDEIAYNEQIIKCTGDLAKADEMFNIDHEHEVSPLNLMAECIDWLFNSSSAEISEVARCNMFVLLRELIDASARKYIMEYREKLSYLHPVAIKDYATTMNFKNKEAEVVKVKEYYEKKRESQLATVKNTAIILFFVFAAVCLVGGVVSMIAVNSVGKGMWALTIILAIVAIVLVIAALAKMVGNNKRRSMINKSINAAIENAEKVIEALFADFADYIKLYTESDRIADDIEYAIQR